jgi:GDP-L-fucose synthase
MTKTSNSKRIYIAQHNGMVGSALIRQLKSDSSNIIITASKEEIDLTNQQAVNQFFANNKIDQVYLTAAKVGGIHENNTYPAEFIYQNLMIGANIINATHMHNVQKLLFLGLSCIYPKLAEQPMSEAALLMGTLESTNEPYTIAKIAEIKLCESYNRQYARDYRSVMPTNLYGQNDNFHLEDSHGTPALIRRFYEAKLNNDSTVNA